MVTARKGAGAIVCRQRAAEDTRLAVEIAISAALGEQADRWHIEWELQDTPFPVRGRSLGLAAAVAAFAAITSRPIPEGHAFTGAVELDGRISAVSSIPGKLRAAAARGVRQVVLPADNDREDASLQLLPSAHLDDLLPRLLPAPTRRTGLLGLLLAPLLVAVLAPTPADLWLQSWLLTTLRGPLPAEQTAIVLLPESQETAVQRLNQRSAHAALIDELVGAGVAAIAFDLDFSNPAPGDDALAAAVTRAADAGVAVIGAVRWREGPRLPGDAALGDALIPALALFEPEFRGNVLLGRMPARRLGPDGVEYWHLAVVATHARLVNAPPPTVSASTLRAGGRRHPLHLGRLYLHPVQPSPQLDYRMPTAGAPDLRGRIVLVGVQAQADVWSTSAGELDGIALHAALIETLSAGQVPRQLSVGENALVAVLLGLLTAVLSRRGRAVLALAGGAVLAGIVVQGPLLPAPVLLLLAAVMGLPAQAPLRALLSRLRRWRG